MARLRSLTRPDLSDEQAHVWDGLVSNDRGVGVELFDEQGGLVGPFNVYLYAPKIGRLLNVLGGTFRMESTLERRLMEVAICTVGAHWRSEFEFWAHRRMAIEHGVDETILDALRDGREPEFARDDERTVHAVTTQLLVDHRVDDVTYAASEVLLGETGMVELGALVGYYCLISTVLNMFEVPLPAGETPFWAL